jgi:hypothetical protein
MADQIPDHLPPEFEVISDRKIVSGIAEDERSITRGFWFDAETPDVPHYVKDEHVLQWAERGLCLRYLPARQVDADWLMELPYGLSESAADRLISETPPEYDPFHIKGGWHLMPAEAIGITGLDDRRGVPKNLSFEIPHARLQDILMGSAILKGVAGTTVHPRYPRAVELIYLRNIPDGSSGVHAEQPLETCVDPVADTVRPEVLCLDYSTKKARLQRLGTSDIYKGVVRPIWPLPDGRDLILNKEAKIV